MFASKKNLFLLIGIIIVMIVIKMSFNFNLANGYKKYFTKAPLTELYLENHNTLPKTTSPHKSYNFSFTVHNLEQAPIKYLYQVKIISTDSAILLNKGTFDLDHEQSKTIQEKFASDDIKGKSRVQVDLINKNQSVHFWIN